VGVFCILSVVCGFFGRGGSVMGWLVSRSVSSMNIWRWISFSSFCVASWTTSWSGVFLLRSSFAIEWFWFVSEFSMVGGCQPFVCRGVEVAGLAFLWMAFLVAGVMGVSLWRLGAPCVSCSFGGSCCSVGGGFWISSY
jgi:hypothetical protein